MNLERIHSSSFLVVLSGVILRLLNMFRLFSLFVVYSIISSCYGFFQYPHRSPVVLKAPSSRKFSRASHHDETLLQQGILSGLTANSHGNVPNRFSSTLEVAVRDIATDAGYRDFAVVNGRVSSIIMMGNSKSEKCEFDGLMVGDRQCFESFCEQFAQSYLTCIPEEDHLAMLEVKLSLDVLMVWLTDKTVNGSRSLFFEKKPIYQNIAKIVVVNEGDKTSSFIKSLQENKPDVAQAAQALKDAKINLFYHPWISAESIRSWTMRMDGMKNYIKEVDERTIKEAEHMKKEAEHMKKEAEYMKKEAERMNKEIEELKGKFNKL
jgi:hypothetical protein